MTGAVLAYREHSWACVFGLFFYAPWLPCSEFLLEQLEPILQRFDYFEFQVLAEIYKEDR
jgi:hypothetical protein